MGNYRRLLQFIRGYERLFGIAVVAMLLATFFKVFELSMLVPLMDRIFNKQPIVVPDHVPAFLQGIVDTLNSISPEVLFRVLPFFVLGGMLIKHALIYSYQFLMNDMAQRILRDVRQKLYAKIQGLSLDFFTEKRTGEMMSRITYDVQVIENAVSYALTDMFVQSFTILFFVTMAFTIHPQAALIVFFVFPLIIWPVNQIGRKLRKLAQQSQERMADINSVLLETISGIKVVKAFGTEEKEIERFKKLNHDFYKLRLKTVRRLLVLPPMTEIFGVICGIAMILWLGRQVMEGHLSSGVFILFFASIMSVISPVKKLGNVNAMTQQALAANERIYHVLDMEPTVKEAPNAVEFPALRETIRYEHVFFRYGDHGDWVLADIDFEIKKGQLVAIVGPTGSGKTTCVNLIPRFYDPQQGALLWDGRNIRHATFRSLRRQIGIVAQETFLFNDTVRANIAYGRDHVSQSEVEMAARQAYAHQFIVNLPQGYDTLIGERGYRLSGGERQRIAIARAILKNPPILILDEATSHLDSESERYVQEALDHLMEGRTVVAIAHRLSTITRADTIVVIEKGRIQGQGPHGDLIKACPLYRRLYETQFQTQMG